MAGTFSLIDWLVVALYLGVTLGIGWRAARGNKNFNE